MLCTGSMPASINEEDMKRSMLARLCAGLAFGMIATTGAIAQDYPTKPLRIVVPFGPGGVADVTARVVAQGLAEKLGKAVVVENYPGAGGISGAQNMLRGDADGYSLFLVSNQSAVSPSMFRSLPYDPVKQFQMVSLIGSFDIVAAVDSKSPVKTIADAMASARKNPDAFNIGTIGVGSTQQLSAELFRTTSGLSVPVVPFKSSGEVLSAVRGNNVQVIFETLPAIIGNVKSGDLRLIGVGATKRNPMFPNVPTIAESGVPNYSSTSWNGIAVKTGTPPAIIATLNKAVRDVVADPATNKKLTELGLTPQTSTPEEFSKYLVTEIDKWRKVIDTAKIEKLM